MRPSTRKQFQSSLRNVTVASSFVVLSMIATPAWAGGASTTNSATSTTSVPSEPLPPPFIETTGHGLVATTTTTTTTTTTATSTSTSGTSAGTSTGTGTSGGTGGNFTSTSSSSLSGTTDAVSSPVDDFQRWLFGLLGMNG